MEPIKLGQSNLLVLGLFCLLLLASACGPGLTSQQHAENTTPPSLTSTPHNQEVIKVQMDFMPSPDTYKEIIQKADLIVIGNVVDTSFTYNAARISEDNPQPFTSMYDLARIYLVQVDQYLKGNQPYNFYITRVEGYAFGSSPEEVQQKVARSELEFTSDPLQPGRPYLLFLFTRAAKDIYPEMPDGNYYWPTYPGIFDISDPAEVRPVIDYGTSYNFDFHLPLDQVLEYIKNPNLIPPTHKPYIELPEANPYSYP